MRIPSLPLRSLVVTTAVSSCATLVAIGAWFAMSARGADPCAIPGGTATLAPSAQGEIARHAMACRDLDHGRITTGDYRRLLGLDTPQPVAQVSPPPAIEWASSVRAVSSEYSPTSWSAQQVLGPPDVYPGSGDNAKAWASREADAPDEFIEVGFAQPTPMRELQIFETFNPGAVVSVDAITISGRHITLSACGGQFTDGPCDGPIGPSGGSTRVDHVPLTCGEAIVAARVTLASNAVPGWNEIDAIGGVPCQAPTR